MRRTLRWMELLAWGVGLLGTVALIFFRVEATEAQKAAQHIAVAAAAVSAGGVVPPPAAAHTPNRAVSVNPSTVIGRLDVPSLGLSVPILNDSDPNSLRRGVGRMKDTAMPGGLGNLVLAGHRDTYFRPLGRVKAGTLMRVVTSDGTFDYVVDSTSIVMPEDVGVMDIGDRPEMTLITCYPFHYIGAAPKRFIVHAHLLSVSGED